MSDYDNTLLKVTKKTLDSLFEPPYSQARTTLEEAIMQDERISMRCSCCGHEYDVDMDLSGKTVRCPECRDPLRVPDLFRKQAPAPIQPEPAEQNRPDLKKLWIIFAIPFAFVALIMVASVLFSPQNPSRPSPSAGSPSPSPSPSAGRLTKENALKIQRGMNHQDVSLILGQPSDKHDTGTDLRIWTYKDGRRQITIVLDRNGNVVEKTYDGID